ncbi:tyrosine-type recombinase/integrase [Humibacter sp. RRB41]|uniref:tyrosine-type recombinase/integrase n=1 Tax=Humibacter sp. RRB41 TaxID=2919946 RepID=UPI001FAA0E2C|nr:tyrosine-type recombinase/integrase [Humibacter sp. RRB41]
MLTEYRNHLYFSGRSEGTVKLRITHVQELLFRHRDLTTITTRDLERHLSEMRKRGLAPETIKSFRSSYRLFFGWAHKAGFMPTDPSIELDPVHIPVRVPRIAPDDVVQAALITATLEQRTMVMLARLACLRLTELTTLHMRAREHDALRIRGKGDKERIVYINDDLMQVLLDREREVGFGYYFPGRFGAYMHPQSVNKIITRLIGSNPHSLRHAGATAAYRATKDLRAVQQMLGHASMATTQRYLHLDEDALRRAAAGTAFITPIRSPHFPRDLQHAA